MLSVIIIIVIIFIIILVGRSNGTENNKSGNTIIKPNGLATKKTSESLKSENLLYKDKVLRTFEIKGLNYSTLHNSLDGEFIGFANCAYNSHGQYAVEILTFEGVKLGYVSKGNKRLNESLKVWHNKKLFAWGNLRYDEYVNKWFGIVNIPVGYEEIEIEKIKAFCLLKLENKKLINNLENSKVSNEHLYKILNNHREIIIIFNKIDNKNDLDYSLPYQTIQKFSKKMENEKDWKNLILLKEYEDLLAEFCGAKPNSVTKRIDKAEKTTNI
jgi:hypothetical protein